MAEYKMAWKQDALPIQTELEALLLIDALSHNVERLRDLSPEFDSEADACNALLSRITKLHNANGR